MKSILTKSFALLSAVVLSSCAGGPSAQTGTLIGAGTGAVAGNLIGRNNGNAAAGTIAGAVVGGAIGNAAGDNVDRNRRARYDYRY